MRSGVGFVALSPRPHHHQLLDDSLQACSRRTVPCLDSKAVEGRRHHAGECVEVRIVRQLTGLLTGRNASSHRGFCGAPAFGKRLKDVGGLDGAVCGAERDQTAPWILRVSKGLCSVKEKAPNSQFRRRLAGERLASKATGFLFVALDRFEEEALLIAEGAVEAWRRDAHRLGEIAYRCSLIAPAPEQTDGTFECFVAIESARPAALLWRYCHVILSDRYINLLTSSRKHRYFCSGHYKKSSSVSDCPAATRSLLHKGRENAHGGRLKCKREWTASGLVRGRS